MAFRMLTSTLRESPSLILEKTAKVFHHLLRRHLWMQSSSFSRKGHARMLGALTMIKTLTAIARRACALIKPFAAAGQTQSGVSIQSFFVSTLFTMDAILPNLALPWAPDETEPENLRVALELEL